MPEPRTAAQNGKLHALLSSEGVTPANKAEMVLQFTDGRTTSSREMFKSECADMIKALEGQREVGWHSKDFSETPGQAQRRKILSTCYDMNLFLKVDMVKRKMVVDRPALDNFLMASTAPKKRLNKMSEAELNLVVTQFKQMNKKAHT